MEELFSLAGEDIKDYFNYESVSIACRYFFENGKRLDAFTDPRAFAAEMQQAVGEPAEHVLQYLRDAAQVYEKVGTIF